MTDNRFIKVRFTQNQPGKSAYQWDVAADLTRISPADAMKIASEFDNTQILKPFCTGPIGVSLQYNTATPYMRPIHHGTLDIQSLFSMPEAYPNNTGRSMPCAAASCVRLPFKKRAQICAANLAAGKCQDEYMRRILGTVLYPHFYANQKGK